VDVVDAEVVAVVVDVKDRTCAGIDTEALA
jgi:hypothetical protein